MAGPASAANPAPSPVKFRNRATEITRLEALSDGTFAFAITLLVVSLEVPATFDELLTVIRGFPAFAVCFTLLIWIWFQHWRFFRRYGLEDAGTVALNSVLLFVVLFYVYPLKFLWTLLLATYSSNPATSKAGATAMQMLDGVQLMQIYGAGFMLIFYLLALLYYRAYALRAKLQLTDLEEFDTRSGIIENVGVGSVGLLSILIVTFGGPRAAFFAGICYGLVGAVKAYHGYWHSTTRTRLERLQVARMEPTIVGVPKVPGTPQQPS